MFSKLNHVWGNLLSTKNQPVFKQKRIPESIILTSSYSLENDCFDEGYLYGIFTCSPPPISCWFVLCENISTWSCLLSSVDCVLAPSQLGVWILSDFFDFFMCFSETNSNISEPFPVVQWFGAMLQQFTITTCKSCWLRYIAGPTST